MNEFAGPVPGPVRSARMQARSPEIEGNQCSPDPGLAPASGERYWRVPVRSCSNGGPWPASWPAGGSWLPQMAACWAWTVTSWRCFLRQRTEPLLLGETDREGCRSMARLWASEAELCTRSITSSAVTIVTGQLTPTSIPMVLAESGWRRVEDRATRKTTTRFPSRSSAADETYGRVAPGARPSPGSGRCRSLAG